MILIIKIILNMFFLVFVTFATQTAAILWGCLDQNHPGLADDAGVGEALQLPRRSPVDRWVTKVERVGDGKHVRDFTLDRAFCIKNCSQGDFPSVNLK